MFIIPFNENVMMSVEKKYWDQRYNDGGTSGPGHKGDNHIFKWKVIDKYSPFLQSVVDVGCGDLSFWEGRECESYTGIDISNTIIKKNMIRCPNWEFICEKAEIEIKGLHKEAVFCMSVLFHIMDLDTYIQILKNLCTYSDNYIFIYTWINNPFRFEAKIARFVHALSKLKIIWALKLLRKAFSNDVFSDGRYQFYRSIEEHFELFVRNGFTLVGLERRPDNIGAVYVFKRTTLVR